MLKNRPILKQLNNLIELPNKLYSEKKSESKGTGEITFIGEKKVQEVEVKMYSFNTSHSELKENIKSFEFFGSLEKDKTYWVNFHGLDDVDLVQALGKEIALERMTIRQMLDTTLRPKLEEYDNYLFFSIKSILRDSERDLEIEQLSFILGEQYVISLQEKVSDHFDHLRNKIVDKLGMIRSKGPDYLLYQLLDAILDNYFETIDSINIEIADTEQKLFSDPSQEVLIKLENLKKVAELIKKSLTPFNDALRKINARKTKFINDEIEKYFGELTNSCIGAIEEINSVSQSLESLTNIYFSSLSQKMNETMKILTTVSTIFIPLTFIAGIYGMNFQNMPELNHPKGYFIVIGVMLIILLGMIYFFKKRKWL
ncbi:MAG: magnesium/cobalt transporter CorA [Reichenbachiella sp.]